MLLQNAFAGKCFAKCFCKMLLRGNALPNAFAKCFCGKMLLPNVFELSGKKQKPFATGNSVPELEQARGIRYFAGIKHFVALTRC